jgi:hypothetical protein
MRVYCGRTADHCPTDHTNRRDVRGLSEIDLEQRRKGDVLGASQSGKHSRQSLLPLLRNRKLIGDARVKASSLVADDLDLARHPPGRPGHVDQGDSPHPDGKPLPHV